MERPLPDDVARPVRAYLVALVSGDEVSDAWHELVADVGYWRERDLLPVLRLAHQVVLQHERVAPEVAALALADLGVDDPDDVATVLDADATAARRWLAQAQATRSEEEPTEAAGAPGRFADRPRPAPAPQPSVTDAGGAPSPPPPPAEPARASTPQAVRIGFDEDDGPLPDLEGAGTSRSAARLVALGVALLVVLLAAWGLVVR